MVRDYLCFGVTPKEFVLFDFLHKTYREKKTFLPDYLKDVLSIKYTGFDKFERDLQDKFHFYELLSPFFARPVMKLTSQTAFETFDEFCKKENSVFIKPLKASYGRGACVYEYKKDSCKLFYTDLLADTGNEYIIESLIRQDAKMAQFNQSSVNTIRLPSIISNGSFTVLGAFMRTGRKGFIVDNGGSGGIFSAIDSNTGRVVTDGMDIKGFVYKHHPDSGISFKGFAIPQWSELLKLAEQAHRLLQGHKYVAWDFAYTSNGWVLIEGNWGQFLSQFVTGVGLKKQFVKLMNN